MHSPEKRRPGAAISWLSDAISANRRLLLGYALVIGLAIAPRAILGLIAGSYTLPEWGGADLPFVIYSITIAFLIAMVRPLYLVVTRHPHPTRQLIADIKRHWPTLLAMTVILLAVPESLDAASRFKKIIPQIQPFYLDPMLIDIERSVLGKDAWLYTHAVLGPTSTRVLDYTYGMWHFVNTGLLCWICLTPNRQLQLRAALSYQLAWLMLGAALATVMSSVGPCFYEDFFGADDFAPLMDRLREISGGGELPSLRAMRYLLASADTDAIGGGISAMPSLHVAIATLFVFVVWERFPKRAWPKVLAIIYAIAIFVGSVHLGWHYVLDGIVSAIVMGLIWLCLGRFNRWIFRATREASNAGKTP